MSAVKVIFSSSHSALQNELQHWLQHTENTILGISMDSNEYGHCLAVLFEPGGSHRYDAQVFFSSRHDGVEAEANSAQMQGRPGGTQLMAIGSNKYGHCLCIIRES